jgi:hypothetical protein
VGYRYLHELFGARFRTHELELGVYFRASEEIQLGLDGDLRWFLAQDGSSRALLLRADWYWEAELFGG